MLHYHSFRKTRRSSKNTCSVRFSSTLTFSSPLTNKPHGATNDDTEGPQASVGPSYGGPGYAERKRTNGTAPLSSFKQLLCQGNRIFVFSPFYCVMGCSRSGPQSLPSLLGALSIHSVLVSGLLAAQHSSTSPPPQARGFPGLPQQLLLC